MTAKWHGWKDVNEVFKDIVNVPSVVSTDKDHRDFFFRGTDNYLHHANFSLSSGTWIQKGKTESVDTKMKIQGTPAAVTRGDGSIDVFARGADNHLWHIFRHSDGDKKWDAWDDLGGTGTKAVLNDSPSAAAWEQNGKKRLDVFVRGTDNHMSTLTWGGDGSGWKGPTDLDATGGKFLMSAPTATSNGANFLDVFAVCADDHLYHKSFNGKEWSANATGGWDNLDGTGGDLKFTGAVTAVSSKDRLDVFVQNKANNHLVHLKWEKGVANGWVVQDEDADLGGALESALSAYSTSVSNEHIDIFAKRKTGTNVHFMHNYWGT